MDRQRAEASGSTTVGAFEQGTGGPLPPRGKAATAATRRARLAIPYLGPHPPPSRAFGPSVVIASVAAAITRACQAAAAFRRADLDRQLLAQGRTVAIQRALESNQAVLDELHTAAIATFAVALVLNLVWREKRRPRAVRTSHGEAYVESPLNWIVKGWPRALVIVPALGAITFWTMSQTTEQTVLEDLPRLRTYAAVACACWALMWLADVVWVVLADRALDRRVAASAEARRAPATVPYFAPVTEHQAASGEPAGVMWVLRTAAMVVGGLGSVLVTAGAAGEFLDGRLAFIGLYAAGVVGDVVVIGLFVRRWRHRRDGPAPVAA
jgi:hypothetical protein